MRTTIYRLLAGAVFAIMLYFTINGVFIRDLLNPDTSIFGRIMLISGYVLIVPVFGTYALFGEARANRVLIWAMRLATLHHTIPRAIESKADELIQRHVTMPPELQEHATPETGPVNPPQTESHNDQIGTVR